MAQQVLRVLVGMPCYGQVQALTTQSLIDLAQMGQVGDEDAPYAFTFGFHPIAIGPYVQNNLTSLLRRFVELKDEFDLFLRVDSDSCWTPEWVDHFFRAVNRVGWIESAYPVIHGGVYARRQRTANHVPVVQWLGEEVEDYLAARWHAENYRIGDTGQVARVGGGWALFNHVAASLPDESWHVRQGIGEDYGGCDAVRLHGGNVYATWPKHEEAELGHVTGGPDYVTIGDYFRVWKEAHGTAALGLERC